MGCSWLGETVLDRIPPSLWTYDLEVVDATPVPLLRVSRPAAFAGDTTAAPDDVALYRDGAERTTVRLGPEGFVVFPPTTADRGAWFYARAETASGTVAMSQQVFLPALRPLTLAVDVLTPEGKPIGALPLTVAGAGTSFSSVAGRAVELSAGDYVVSGDPRGYGYQPFRLSTSVGGSNDPVGEKRVRSHYGGSAPRSPRRSRCRRSSG